MKNYLLLIVSLSFILGVVPARLGMAGDLPFISVGILFFTLFAALILSRKKDLLFTALLFLLVAFLGFFRYAAYNRIGEENVKNYISYPKETVLLQGRIASDPEEKGLTKTKTTFSLKVSSVKLQGAWQETGGLALVNIHGVKGLPYQYGDIMVLEGNLTRPFSYYTKSRFDYRKYLANKRIYSILNVREGSVCEKIGEDSDAKTGLVRFIYSVRKRLMTHIERFFEEPFDSILGAILLGKREKIPSDLRDLFAKTGTLHILAISGLHVGIIYFVLRVILKIFRFPRNAAVVVSVLFLGLFAILAGARPSILRASTMFSILGFGEILKRKISIFNLIGFSCFIILFFSPNQLFEIGFILSYVAVLSIVVISPIFYRVFSYGDAPKGPQPFWRKFNRYLLSAFSVSLAVWVGLAPVIAHYFALISPIVVVANLLVVPLLFVIMGCGLLFISLGLFSELIALIASQSTWFFLFILLKSVKFFKNIPFSHFEVDSPGVFGLMLYYFVLSIVLMALSRKGKPTFSFLT